MTKEQREQLLDLATRLQIACISYGKAEHAHEQYKTGGSKMWLDGRSKAWKEAEDKFREFVAQA